MSSWFTVVPEELMVVNKIILLYKEIKIKSIMVDSDIHTL